MFIRFGSQFLFLFQPNISLLLLSIRIAYLVVGRSEFFIVINEMLIEKLAVLYAVTFVDSKYFRYRIVVSVAWMMFL